MYEYENRIVGILLGYFRETRSKTDSHFTRKSFVSWKSEEVLELCKSCNKYCTHKVDICSTKTNRTIEKGETAKNVCFYIDFASKLGFQYSMNQLIIDIITHSEIKLIQLIKSNTKNEWESFRAFLIHNLENKQNVIYFAQMMELYIALADLILSRKLPNMQLVHMIENVYPHLNERSRFIAVYFLYAFYSFFQEDKGKGEYYLRLGYALDYNNVELILLNKRLDLTTLEFYHFLCSFPKEKLNSFELFTIHRLLTESYILLNQYYEAREHSDICLKIATAYTEELPEREQYLSYCLKGVVYYHLKDYHTALMYFKKVYYYDINLLYNDFILFMDCFEKMHETESMMNYLNKDVYQMIIIDSVKRLYKYYQQKYHAQYSNKELQNYILEELGDILIPDSSHYHIIKNDMIYYCQMSKNYKSLFLFENMEKQR